MAREATALLEPCFLRKRERTALASSLSATRRFEGTVVNA